MRSLRSGEQHASTRWLNVLLATIAIATHISVLSFVVLAIYRLFMRTSFAEAGIDRRFLTCFLQCVLFVSYPATEDKVRQDHEIQSWWKDLDRQVAGVPGHQNRGEENVRQIVIRKWNFFRVSALDTNISPSVCMYV